MAAFTITPHNRTLEVKPGRIKKLESISLISDSLSQMVFSVLLCYSDNDRLDFILFQFFVLCRFILSLQRRSQDFCLGGGPPGRCYPVHFT